MVKEEVNIPAKEAKKRLGSANRRAQQNLFHLLENCRTLRNLSQIHAQLLLHGYDRKPFLLAKLLCLYVTYARPALVLAAAARTQNPTTTVSNQLIRAHALTTTPWLSLRTFNHMTVSDSDHAKPDAFTYSFLLAACARSDSLRHGEMVHARALANGYCSGVYVLTNLVNMYSSSDVVLAAQSARRAFDEMPERTLVSWNALLKAHARRGDAEGAWRVFSEMPERNTTSWTSVVWACSRAGLWKEALSVFHAMTSSGVEPDPAAMVAAVSACADSTDPKLGNWIHRRAEENGPTSINLSNALVHMHVTLGDITRARRSFEQMTERDAASWTTIIAGLARHGRGREALELFREMLATATPDAATFVAALCACSHSGLVNEGLELFHIMTREFGVEPGVEHYGCLVDLLSRAGLLNEARGVVEAMPVKPGRAVWGALVHGCRLHGNVGLAAAAATKLFLAELSPGYLVLLSNAYASAQRWRDVAGVRLEMVESGMKKPAGQSRILVGGSVHGFVAGHADHPVRRIIVDLTGHSRKESFEANIDFTHLMAL